MPPVGEKLPDLLGDLIHDSTVPARQFTAYFRFSRSSTMVAMIGSTMVSVHISTRHMEMKTVWHPVGV